MKAFIATEPSEPLVIHGIGTDKEALKSVISERTDNEFTYDVYEIDINKHPIVTADKIRDLKKYNKLTFVEHVISKQLN